MSIPWFPTEYGKIIYHEKDGEVFWLYQVKVHYPTKYHSEVYRIFKSYGKVPKHIVILGSSVIRMYVESKVKEEIREQGEEDRRMQDYLRNTNFPVSVRYQGVLLEGKIKSAHDSHLRVELLTPVTGESGITFGWASAVTGRRIFDDNLQFTPIAIQRAKELLIEIYKKNRYQEQHTDTIQLVEELNEGI